MADCPICLDKLHDPVAAPCGHLSCDACIKTYVRASSDPYEATCPTCRAPFPIVMPNMTIVPKKYHTFMSSPLRRVFIEDEASRALIDDLNAENKALHTRVASLKRDKNLLMDRCEAAQSAASNLTAAERGARLACDKAKEEARLANLNLERLRVEYDALKSSRARGESSLVAAAKVKRSSGQAALDDSPCPSDYRPRITRSILPIPKRARLRSVCAPSASTSMEQTAQRSLGPPSQAHFARSSTVGVSSPSASASSSSAPPLPRKSLQLARRERIAFYEPRSLPDDSPDDEADNHGERSNVEDTLPTYSTVPWKRLRHRTVPETLNSFS